MHDDVTCCMLHVARQMLAAAITACDGAMREMLHPGNVEALQTRLHQLKRVGLLVHIESLLTAFAAEVCMSPMSSAQLLTYVGGDACRHGWNAPVLIHLYELIGEHRPTHVWPVITLTQSLVCSFCRDHLEIWLMPTVHSGNLFEVTSVFASC